MENKLIFFIIKEKCIYISEMLNGLFFQLLYINAINQT